METTSTSWLVVPIQASLSPTGFSHDLDKKLGACLKTRKERLVIELVDSTDELERNHVKVLMRWLGNIEAIGGSLAIVGVPASLGILLAELKVRIGAPVLEDWKAFDRMFDNPGLEREARFEESEPAWPPEVLEAEVASTATLLNQTAHKEETTKVDLRALQENSTTSEIISDDYYENSITQTIDTSKLKELSSQIAVTSKLSFLNQTDVPIDDSQTNKIDAVLVADETSPTKNAINDWDQKNEDELSFDFDELKLSDKEEAQVVFEKDNRDILNIKKDVDVTIHDLNKDELESSVESIAQDLEFHYNIFGDQAGEKSADLDDDLLKELEKWDIPPGLVSDDPKWAATVDSNESSVMADSVASIEDSLAQVETYGDTDVSTAIDDNAVSDLNDEVDLLAELKSSGEDSGSYDTRTDIEPILEDDFKIEDKSELTEETQLYPTEKFELQEVSPKLSPITTQQAAEVKPPNKPIPVHGTHTIYAGFYTCTSCEKGVWLLSSMLLPKCSECSKNSGASALAAPAIKWQLVRKVF